MSCVCILTPVIIVAWPAFSGIAVAVATSLGYNVVQDVQDREQVENRIQNSNRIELEIPQSELVTGTLARENKLVIRRGNVTVTFARDMRGKASITVEGKGQTQEALQAMGEELSQRIVQKYVYQRIMDEMRSRQFMVVEEAVEADQTIRLKVRHWEN